MTRVADTERTRYLGFELLVRERDVRVLDSRGRVLGVAYSVAGARRLVRRERGSKR